MTLTSEYLVKGLEATRWHKMYGRKSIEEFFIDEEQMSALDRGETIIAEKMYKRYGRIINKKVAFQIRKRIISVAEEKETSLEQYAIDHLERFGNTYVNEMTDKLEKAINERFGSFRISETKNLGGGYILDVRK